MWAKTGCAPKDSIDMKSPWIIPNSFNKNLVFCILFVCVFFWQIRVNIIGSRCSSFTDFWILKGVYDIISGCIEFLKTGVKN